MTCPVCGGDVKVVNCCSDPDSIYRRRKCLDCDYEFYTTESELPESKGDFTDVKRRFYREHSRRVRENRAKSSAK